MVLIAQAPSHNDGAPTRQRAVVRTVANYLRGDVRMVDEVARLDDGRFLVILPHTRREGGRVVMRATRRRGAACARRRAGHGVRAMPLRSGG